MSASGSSDPRLRRPDPGDYVTRNLHGAIESAHSVAGPGAFSSAGFAGNVIHTRKARRAAVPAHPFKVFITGNAKNGFQRGVHYESQLFKARDSILYPTKQTITGLLTELSPAADDDGWAETSEGDFIWLDLRLVIDGGTGAIAIDTAQIHSRDVDDDWNGGEFEHDEGNEVGEAVVYQIYRVRLKLAMIEADGDGLRVLQLIRDHRVMEQTYAKAYSFEGGDPQFVTATYPFPL